MYVKSLAKRNKSNTKIDRQAEAWSILLGQKMAELYQTTNGRPLDNICCLLV